MKKTLALTAVTVAMQIAGPAMAGDYVHEGREMAQAVAATGVSDEEASTALLVLCHDQGGGGVGWMRRDGRDYRLLTCNSSAAHPEPDRAFMLRRVTETDLPK